MDGHTTFRRFLRGVLFFILSGWAALVSAGTTDPNTPDSRYVEFGRQFPGIVRVKALLVLDEPEPLLLLDGKEVVVPKPDKPEPKPQLAVQYGSGVVIRPHWLLTASHVVRGASAAIAVKDGGHEHMLEKVIHHKDFDDKQFGFHDLALCYSSKHFDLEFYTPLYTDLDEVGKAATISGYGSYGTFHTGAKNSDGKKRAGHNKIDSAERTVLICTPSVTGRFPLEFMIAPGDSGGGMFIGNKLAGINSFLMAADKKPDGTYGDESAFTRVSLYVDWINEQIGLHELTIAGKITTAPDLTNVGKPQH